MSTGSGPCWSWLGLACETTIWPPCDQTIEIWNRSLRFESNLKSFFFLTFGNQIFEAEKLWNFEEFGCRPRYSHTHFTKNLLPTILYQFCDDVVRPQLSQILQTLFSWIYIHDHELCFSKSVHVVPTYSKCTHQDQAKAQDCALKMSELLWQLTVCFTVRWSAGLWSHDCC